MRARLAAARPSELEFILGAAAVVWVAYSFVAAGVHGFGMIDFTAFRAAGVAVLHGRSPYPPATYDALVQAKALVYPALVGYLFVPFALLPPFLSGFVFCVVMVAAMVAALWLVGLRDWRCFAAPFVAYPMLTAFANGALGTLLALALAVAWRCRDRARVTAAVLAIAIVAKLFLWPLGLWLLATRRWRAAAATAVLTAVLFVAPFLPLGVHTLTSYPHLLHKLDATFGPISYTPHALLRELGASSLQAGAGVVALGVALAASMLVLGRRGRDEHAFATAVAAALLLTPISWPHYYVLLYVPLAVCRPRLSPIWFAPLAFFAMPGLNTSGSPWRAAIGIGIVACVLARCLRGERAPAFRLAGSWTS